MDPLLHGYLTNVLDILLTAGGEELEGLEFYTAGEIAATLDVTIRFPGGTRFVANLTVDIFSGNPLWRTYSFHYMTSDNVCIFRYDDSGHHHELLNYPHHKHEGPDETVFSCPQPTVRTIRDEIEKYLMDNS